MFSSEPKGPSFGFFRRLIEIFLLSFLAFAPSLAGFLLLRLTGSQSFLLWALFVTFGVSIAVLVNTEVFEFVQSKFPATRKIATRMIFIACILSMYGAWTVASPEATAVIAGLASIIMAAIFVVIAYLFAFFDL